MADPRLPTAYGAAQGLLPRGPLASERQRLLKSWEQLAAPYVAEFVGTFVLVFIVSCCSLAAGSAAWNPMAVGCALMVMVYATGPVSGGNLNPAVSLMLGLVGALRWPVALKYAAVQVMGGLAASLSFGSVFPMRMGRVGPAASFMWEYAALAEAIYTAVLCFVVGSCVASARNNPRHDPNQFFGVAIGFAAAAGGFAVGGISGACLNPALALGLDFRFDFSGASVISKWALVWTAAELAGAAIAAGLLCTLRPGEFKGIRLLGEGAALEGLDNHEPPLLLRCASEFLGVFVLVLTVGLNMIASSPSTAWSVAAALMCMVYSLGDVSGHFNPVVTLAVALCDRGRCPPRTALAYLTAQIFAACVAGVVYAQFHAVGPNSRVTYGLGPNVPIAGSGFRVARCVELFFSFVLAYVVLSCTTVVTPAAWRTRQNAYFALAVGACVVAGGFAIGDASSGELNPAVSVGISIADWMHTGAGPSPPFRNCLVFSYWEIAGGILAAVVFRLTHASEFEGAHQASPLDQFWKQLSIVRSEGATPYIAEFVGTFVLVFTIGCCSLARDSLVWRETAIGSILVAMVYATGPVSGGNLNPAVSLSLGLAGVLRWPVVLGYWAAQLAAGIASGVCFCLLFAMRSVRVQPAPPFHWCLAALAEVLFTFMVCFVVNCCASSKPDNPSRAANQFYALAVGLALTAGGYAAGGISGACFNPAVSLGFDLAGVTEVTGWSLLWSLAELMGAVLAAAACAVVRREDFGVKEEHSDCSPTLRARCASEFMGAFMLVLTVGLNTTMASPAVAWSAAAALMCMIYSLGSVSGAHFNPAVTFAVCLSGRGKCSARDGLAYVASQTTAAACAGLIYAQFHAAGPNKAITYGLGPGAGYSLKAAGAAELVFTFVLAYAVLSCATVPAPMAGKTWQNAYFALAIGSCVAVGGFAIGAVSGGELNPAVSAGIWIANMSHHGSAAPPSLAICLALSLWELAGGALAAAVFRLTHAGEFRRTPPLAK